MLARDKFIKMLLFLEKRDRYHTKSVFIRTIVFKYRRWETQFRHEGVLGQVDIQWLSDTRYRIIRKDLG